MDNPQFIISTRFATLKQPLLNLETSQDHKLIVTVWGSGPFTFKQQIFDREAEVFSAETQLSRENVLKELSIFRKYFNDKFDIVMFSMETTQEKVEEMVCELTKS